MFIRHERAIQELKVIGEGKHPTRKVKNKIQ